MGRDNDSSSFKGFLHSEDCVYFFSVQKLIRHIVWPALATASHRFSRMRIGDRSGPWPWRCFEW